VLTEGIEEKRCIDNTRASHFLDLKKMAIKTLRRVTRVT